MLGTEIATVGWRIDGDLGMEICVQEKTSGSQATVPIRVLPMRSMKIVK